MSKFRELKGKELLSLEGKWLVDKDDTSISMLVVKIDTDVSEVVMNNAIYTNVYLYNNYIHKDGTPIGIKIELSSDGYTLEEFIAKANDDCSNVEIEEINSNFSKLANCSSKEMLISMILHGGIRKFRIKPTPKYIRPKVGFRGSVMCEVTNEYMAGWLFVEVVAVVGGIDGVCYRGVNNDYTQARLLPFSADNPPPVGTRFRIIDWGEGESFARYASPTEDNWFSSEKDGDFTWNKDIIWIDFEEVK